MSENNEVMYTADELIQYQGKSFFNQQNYVPDNVTQAFSEDVTIDLDSLKNLNKMINEKVRIIKNEGFICSIDIKFENKQTQHFGRWDELERYTWNDTEPISSIVLTWKMNLKFEGVEFPQPQILTVKISNGLKPEEFMNLILSGSLGDITDIDNNFFPIVVQSVFTDRVFGNELIEVVSRWQKTVLRRDWINHKSILMLKKHRKKISKFLEYFLYFSILFGTGSRFINLLSTLISDPIGSTTTSSFIIIAKYFMYVAIIWKVSPKFSHWISKNVYKYISDYGQSYIFNITKKDTERFKEMQKQNKYDILKASGLILINLGISFSSIFFETFIIKLIG